MGDQRVLVAFASQAGSTAGIAATIAAVLRRSGYAVDCRIASDVTDLSPYTAIVLGSGVFVPSRHSDGGGFLVRHAGSLGGRALWLFCAGPIGRGRCPAGAASLDGDDCSVASVARAVGARGAAMFGPIGLSPDGDPVEELGPVNVQRVRAWAAEIAAQLRPAALPPGDRPEPGRHHSRVRPAKGPAARRRGHVATRS